MPLRMSMGLYPLKILGKALVMCESKGDVMPDPYWEDVAKKVSESRARGQSRGKEEIFFKPYAGAGGTCTFCGQVISIKDGCDCLRPSARHVNAPKDWRI